MNMVEKTIDGNTYTILVDWNGKGYMAKTFKAFDRKNERTGELEQHQEEIIEYGDSEEEAIRRVVDYIEAIPAWKKLQEITKNRNGK